MPVVIFFYVCSNFGGNKNSTWKEIEQIRFLQGAVVVFVRFLFLKEDVSLDDLKKN